MLNNKHKKVCMLTSAHHPFDVRIFQKEARSLIQAGFDVTLIAQYNKDEIVDGVKILGLQKPRNRIARMTKTTSELYHKALSVDADIYHFHEPELMPCGLKLLKKGKKVIYDIHEDTRQQILTKRYLHPMVRKCISRFYAMYEDYACRKFSALIVPITNMLLHYEKLNLTAIVENYVDLSLYPPRDVDFTRPVLFHAGSLDPGRGLYNMINAAKCVKEPFIFYIAGELRESLDASSLQPLTYLGHLNQEEVVETYRKSNIGIIPLNRVGQYVMAGGNKVYEYMANSIPVIFPDFGEWCNFNAVHKCGINVNVQSGKDVAAAISYLVNNPNAARQMGLNGRRWVEEKYSWGNAFKKLKDLYNQVLTS